MAPERQLARNSANFSAHLLFSPSPPNRALSDFSVLLAIQETLKLLGAQKNGQELGYGAMRSREVRREALKRREPQKESNQWKKTEARYGRRERGNYFGVIFKVFFLGGKSNSVSKLISFYLYNLWLDYTCTLVQHVVKYGCIGIFAIFVVLFHVGSFSDNSMILLLTLFPSRGGAQHPPT